MSLSLLVHYFTLVAVMWMGAEALLMFQKLVIVFVQITTKFIVFVSIICWSKLTISEFEQFLIVATNYCSCYLLFLYNRYDNYMHLAGIYSYKIYKTYMTKPCQGNFGPEKFDPGDQCSMEKNSPPRTNFSWNISPVAKFRSAMQN